MLEDIKARYADLMTALQHFNQSWPDKVIDGAVYRLPLLAEQKAPVAIRVERLEGEEAVAAAQEALTQFELALGQAAGTVMRLPGYFVLSESALDQVLAINACKAALDDSIEQTRIELGMVKAARPRIMRKALGSSFLKTQLTRNIQAFDAAPRLLLFSWAGHTTGTERISVGEVRQQLSDLAELRADRTGGESELESPEELDLKAIANLADNSDLLKYKKVAPHPRVMVFLSGNSRYDAMLHANLPVFVLQGEMPMEVRELEDFDRDAQRAPRPDKKTRTKAMLGRPLFLAEAKRKAKPEAASSIPGVASTYRRQEPKGLVRRPDQE